MRLLSYLAEIHLNRACIYVSRAARRTPHGLEQAKQAQQEQDEDDGENEADDAIGTTVHVG